MDMLLKYLTNIRMKELVAFLKKKNHSDPKRQTWYGVTYNQIFLEK